MLNKQTNKQTNENDKYDTKCLTPGFSSLPANLHQVRRPIPVLQYNV